MTDSVSEDDLTEINENLTNLNERLEAENRKLESENKKLKRKQERNKDLEKRVTQLEVEMEAMSSFEEHEQPEWITRAPGAFAKNAIACLAISDLHLDEVVHPEQIGGMNAYNRQIALQRWDNTIKNFVDTTKGGWSDVEYDGCIVPFNGDIFSGDIHEELKESNEDTLLGSVDFWIDPLAEGIQYLLQEFGNVHIPVTPGNHGRTTRKPRAKFRARSNFDWFIGAQIARVFRNEPRVTFHLSDSADAMVDVYDKTMMISHGDQARGGSGIGGLWPPVMRLDARKRQRQEAIQQGYDILVLGHWHTLTFGPAFIINGAMKGYDEYAYTENFGFEQPSQAAWLMTPEHGKTWTAPIFSQNRILEGW